MRALGQILILFIWVYIIAVPYGLVKFIKRNKNGFKKIAILRYSFLISSVITFPISIGIFIGNKMSENAQSDTVMISSSLFAWAGLTAAIFALWLFSRFTASKAEEAGRSYVAFMILSFIFWPTVIVVLLFKPESEKKSESVTSIPNQTVVTQLEQLEKLHAQGIIDADEFKKAKGKLLN